jgi:hypothetical protein
MVKAETHTWEFKARFRRSAFGWRSQPAVQRVKQAVSEIKKVARREPALAADGAVCLLERLSPALERVASSSGVIGSAVNRAIDDLAPIIAGAPADVKTRADQGAPGASSSPAGPSRAPSPRLDPWVSCTQKRWWQTKRRCS